jgi:hypothetical protein
MNSISIIMPSLAPPLKLRQHAVGINFLNLTLPIGATHLLPGYLPADKVPNISYDQTYKELYKKAAILRINAFQYKVTTCDACDKRSANRM